MSTGEDSVVCTPLCQGFLKKRKDKIRLRWVTYWFELHNASLFFYTRKHGNISDLRGQYYLIEVECVREVTWTKKSHYVFEITMKNGKRKVLAAETADLRQQWMCQLLQAMNHEECNTTELNSNGETTPDHVWSPYSVISNSPLQTSEDMLIKTYHSAEPDSSVWSPSEHSAEPVYSEWSPNVHFAQPNSSEWSPSVHSAQPNSSMWSPSVHSAQPNSSMWSPSVHSAQPNSSVWSPNVHSAQPNSSVWSPSVHSAQPNSSVWSPSVHSAQPVSSEWSPSLHSFAVIPTTNSHFYINLDTCDVKSCKCTRDEAKQQADVTDLENDYDVLPLCKPLHSEEVIYDTPPSNRRASEQAQETENIYDVPKHAFRRKSVNESYCAEELPEITGLLQDMVTCLGGNSADWFRATAPGAICQP